MDTVTASQLITLLILLIGLFAIITAAFISGDCFLQEWKGSKRINRKRVQRAHRREYE